MTFVDLSVQAVRGHKEGRRRKGGEKKKVPKKMIWSKKMQKHTQQLTVTASLQAGV